MWLRCAKPILYFEETLRKSSNSPWLLCSLSAYSSTPRKSKLAPLQERRMIDRFKLFVKGGGGGSGCSSVRRSQHDRCGHPDGGNGGRGGDVILECSSTVWDFSSLQHHVNAKRGGHGSSKNKIGTRGADKVIQVPVGTVIHLINGEIPSGDKNESPSSADLDPWDIPGTLDGDPPILDQQQNFCSHNMAEEVESVEKTGIVSISSCIEKTVKESGSMKQSTRAALISAHSQVSPVNKASKICTESLSSGDEEGGSEWEAVKTDNDFSETEQEDIQYNVAELTEQGQRLIVAHGGEGGLGNVCTKVPKKPKVTKAGVHRVTALDLEVASDDKFSSSTGLPGSEAVLLLELKSIADVGLVGMPNAGKSTLLGAMSRAKPTVSHYAFTTLRPNLGNLNYDDLSITVADIPGLIKGAHENRGLGHAFLRHIERTKVLAYVVDLAAALDGGKGIPPWEQLKDLVLELEHHQEGLSGRPSLVVANKIDEEGAEEVYEELKRRVHGVPIFPVCAVLEEGISELKAGLKTLVNGGESYRLNLDGIFLD